MDPADLPESTSGNLGLAHPTREECFAIWTQTATSWRDSLTLPLYLEESQFLTTVPLARDGGMTTWILTDANGMPNERPILSSCETIRKRALISDEHGHVEEAIVHGIASVFCAAPYRRRGYAARHMREMARVLRTWQREPCIPCVGSILYSDIGKTFYSKLGWMPNATNTHLKFAPRTMEWSNAARPISEADLAELCRRDEAIVRAAMRIPAPGIPKRVTILPDLNHMLWHIRKEDFATKYIFGDIPRAKGALAGALGKQVWAIWTHRYYRHPRHTRAPGDPGDAEPNVLYILRLVIEGDPTANKDRSTAGTTPLPLEEYAAQVASLTAVLEAAQLEAAQWELDQVVLWEPSPLAHQLITQSGLEFGEEERTEESIASGMWYDRDENTADAPVWINNEHYAWL